MRRVVDRLATFLLWAAAIGVLVLLAFFIGYIVYLGWHAISWHFLTSPPSEVDAGGGIGPEIYNSFYILVLTLIFTAPIAIAGGIYLQEYARPGWFTSTVQFCAESLATIPSIVMGLFGLIVFGELPDLWVWVGAAIIAGSGIFMLYYEHWQRQHQRGT